MDSEWLILGNPKADHLTLGVEGIVVDEGYNSERAVNGGLGQETEMLVSKLRLTASPC